MTARRDGSGSRPDGRIAGLTALVSVACWLGALVLANAHGGNGAVDPGAGLGQPVTLSRSAELLAFHAGIHDQTLSMVLRCLGLAFTGLAAWSLDAFIRARRPATTPWMVRAAFGGALFVVVSTVFGFFALAHVADQFVHSGIRTTPRASHLIDASGRLKLAAVLDLLSRVVFGAWVAIASRELMNAGLLDRFMAYWGFGAAAALVILPIGDAMFIAWLGTIGVIALGYWPGGRPDGWRALPAGG
jgi:hypothetical protein